MITLENETIQISGYLSTIKSLTSKYPDTYLPAEGWPLDTSYCNLNLNRFPSASRKKPKGKNTYRCFGSKYSPEHTCMGQIKRNSQKIGKRNLNKPKEYKVYHCWCFCVAGTVKSLYRHHPPTINKKRVRDNTQPFTPYRNNPVIHAKDAYQCFIKEEKHQ